MFYIQHGYGKTTKIDDCTAGGNVAGVILSPGHEDVAALAQTARHAAELGLRVLLDPQSYVYATDPKGQLRFHEAQGLAFTGLSWAMSASELIAMTTAVGEANRRAGVASPWISSGPFHRNLSDHWVPASIQFARTAHDDWQTGVIATIAIDESVLGDWERIEEWLDALTALDIAGFYLLVSRPNPIYPPGAWETQNLVNLMRLIHSLAVVNEYELIWGYADIDGLLGIAAGATGVASGWSYGLRQFGVERYSERRTGGAAAVPRVYVPAILSDIRNNEAEDIYRKLSSGPDIFPEPTRSEFQSRSFMTLGNPDAQGIHLAGLAHDVRTLAELPSLAARLNALENRLANAQEILGAISSTGLTLDPRYSGRVTSYLRAIAGFRASVDL